MFAVYYDQRRLTKPGTEYEARMDLMRLQALFLHLVIRQCGIEHEAGSLQERMKRWKPDYRRKSTK